MGASLLVEVLMETKAAVQTLTLIAHAIVDKRFIRSLRSNQFMFPVDRRILSKLERLLVGQLYQYPSGYRSIREDEATIEEHLAAWSGIFFDMANSASTALPPKSANSGYHGVMTCFLRFMTLFLFVWHVSPTILAN